MKKICYIFLMLLLLSGCGKHFSTPDLDFGNESGSYIFFDADVISTKGTLISENTLPAEAEKSSFGVFGFRPDGSHVFSMYASSPAGQQHASAFDNVAFMFRPEDGAAFIYDALVLWEKGEHDFYAYYPYENPKGAAVSDISATGRPYMEYVQPVELEEMTDVMTAAALNMTSADEDAQPVRLKFEHRLFAFDVILNNMQSASARNLRIQSAEVRFINVCAGASLYFDDGPDADAFPDVNPAAADHDMISHNFALPEDFTIDAPAEGESSVEYNLNETSSFLFLPCAGLQVEFSMSFLNAWNEECVFDLERTITPDGGFQPGHKYALVINMRDSGQEMLFVPEIKAWDSFTDIEIEFH